jgi:hypothetical protein
MSSRTGGVAVAVRARTWPAFRVRAAGRGPRYAGRKSWPHPRRSALSSTATRPGGLFSRRPRAPHPPGSPVVVRDEQRAALGDARERARRSAPPSVLSSRTDGMFELLQLRTWSSSSASSGEHDDGRPGQQQRRQLVGQRLSTARRQNERARRARRPRSVIRALLLAVQASDARSARARSAGWYPARSAAERPRIRALEAATLYTIRPGRVQLPRTPAVEVTDRDRLCRFAPDGSKLPRGGMECHPESGVAQSPSDGLPSLSAGENPPSRPEACPGREGGWRTGLELDDWRPAAGGTRRVACALRDDRCSS